jgi:hypothetical protein
MPWQNIFVPDAIHESQICVVLHLTFDEQCELPPASMIGIALFAFQASTKLALLNLQDTVHVLSTIAYPSSVDTLYRFEGINP